MGGKKVILQFRWFYIVGLNGLNELLATLRWALSKYLPRLVVSQPAISLLHLVLCYKSQFNQLDWPLSSLVMDSSCKIWI